MNWEGYGRKRMCPDGGIKYCLEELRTTTQNLEVPADVLTKYIRI
jgi:hypothetical protein